MPSIVTGASSSTILQIGGVLTVSGDAQGSVRRIANPIGSGPVYPPVPFTGSTLTFGPFDELTIFSMLTTRGTINYDVSTPSAGSGNAYAAKFTKTISAYRTSTVNIPAGSTLTLVGAATGYIVGLGALQFYTGTDLTIAATNVTRTVRVTSTGGDITVTTGWSSGALPDPDFVRTFDQIVTNGAYTTFKDFLFGTSGNIKNVTDLAVSFSPYAANLVPTGLGINNEIQRYVDFTNAANFVFTADALELTATVAAGPTLLNRTIAAAVNNSFQITVDDATNIVPGMVASAAAAHVPWVVQPNGIRGVVTTGGTATAIISHVLTAAQGGFDPVTITVTAQAGDTQQTIAQALVTAINANATLQAFKIEATKTADGIGGYSILWPRLTTATSPNAPAFGNMAVGSVNWLNITLSAVSLTHDVFNRILVPFVVSIAGNVLTMSHRFTHAAGTPFYVSPSRVLYRTTTTYPGSNALIALNNTTGLSVGQVLTFNSRSSSLMRIVSIDPNVSITMNAAVGASDGMPFFAQYMYGATTSAATTASPILSFAAVPVGVQIGMTYQDATNATPPPGDLRVQAIDRTTTPQTVTLTGNASIGNGVQAVFFPSIHAGQIWGKDTIKPTTAAPWVAVEFETDSSDMRQSPSWPALWGYRDTTDPIIDPVPAGANGNEIDLFEGFNYTTNTVSGEAQPGAVGATATLYNDPIGMPVPRRLRGNNYGLKTRKTQLLWNASSAYFYADGSLIVAQAAIINTSQRMQFAANLAMGSISNSFNSNGFFPMDWSQLMIDKVKLRVKRMRILTGVKS